MKSKIVFGSILITCYFIGLQLIYHFEIEAVLMGVFGELLTIPALFYFFYLLKTGKMKGGNYIQCMWFQSFY